MYFQFFFFQARCASVMQKEAKKKKKKEEEEKRCYIKFRFKTLYYEVTSKYWSWTEIPDSNNKILHYTQLHKMWKVI